MKRVLAEAGHLADERPEHIEGYLAERPQTLSGCIRVWSPCGCCWTYMSANASVLTQCDSANHDFNWKEAEEALGLLLAAEKLQAESEHKVDPSSQLAIIPYKPSL